MIPETPFNNNCTHGKNGEYRMVFDVKIPSNPLLYPDRNLLVRVEKEGKVYYRIESSKSDRDTSVNSFALQ